MLSAADSLRHAAEPGERVMAAVVFAGLRGHTWRVQKVTVFGNEQEDEAVNDTEKLLVVFQAGQLPIPQQLA